MRSRSKERKKRSYSSPTRDTTLPSSAFENRPSPSTRDPLRLSPHSASVVDREFLTEDLTFSFFEDLQISSQDTPAKNPNPRIFPYSVKQQCWQKAEKIKGRNPERWRRDALGNVLFRKLVGCPGCLCHDYDHIIPYSKGGKSTLENCRVLQATVNRSKGNRTEMSKAELIQKSSYCRLSGRDMDLLELSAYGNVSQTEDSGGCRIQ